jgi:hypothetical protein
VAWLDPSRISTFTVDGHAIRELEHTSFTSEGGLEHVRPFDVLTLDVEHAFGCDGESAPALRVEDTTELRR